MKRLCLIAMAGVASVAMAAPASADVFSFNFDRPDGAYIAANGTGTNRYGIPNGDVNDSAGIISNINTSFNNATNQFDWSVTFGGQIDGNSFHTTNAFWLVLTPGGLPTSPGDAAIMYFDASGPNPILSVYSHNGNGLGNSYADGDNAGAAPDFITSSQSNAGINLDVTQTPAGTKMSISMDASIIQSHVPLYGAGAWNGLGFGPAEIGIWFHSFTNVQSSYNGDLLTAWSPARHGWYDGINQPIPAPGVFALLGVAGLASTRRRRD